MLPVTEDMLTPAGEVTVEGRLPAVELGISLYDALAAMLVANSDWAEVKDGDRTAGLISRHRILSIDYPAEAG